LLRERHGDRAAGRLDLLARLRRDGDGRIELQRLLELAEAEDLQALRVAADQPLRDRRVHVDRGARLEWLLGHRQVRDGPGRLEVLVVEAAARQAAEEPHRAALEAEADRVAAARVVAVHAAAAALAVARAGSATDAEADVPLRAGSEDV